MINFVYKYKKDHLFLSKVTHKIKVASPQISQPKIISSNELLDEIIAFQKGLTVQLVARWPFIFV